MILINLDEKYAANKVNIDAQTLSLLKKGDYKAAAENFWLM
jgi:hypothetical protein